MKKLATSILFLLIIVIIPTASPALTVKLYQATMATVASSTPFHTFTTATAPACVSLVGTHGNRVRIDNVGGTARACVVNGATTDEVRLFNAKITLLQATTIVIEMTTGTNELTSAAAGTYSFAAALKNVAALSSSNLPKTANGILFKVVANNNDINQSGAVSVTCGTTSAGTVAWSTSSTCNKTETEPLTISTGPFPKNITHVARYELRATAAIDFFNFPASGHAPISKIKGVDGGNIEICITLGEETCIDQYPPVNYQFEFRAPLDGSRGSLSNTVVINGYLNKAQELDFGIPFVCSSKSSTPFDQDDKCSIAVTKTPSLGQWRDIDVLKVQYSLSGGICPAAFRIMIELDDFRRFFFNMCTPTQQPSDSDVTDRKGLAQYNLLGVGGRSAEDYGKSLALVGNATVRRIAVGLDLENGKDRSVEISGLVVNGDTITASTGQNYVHTPANELPLQGFEFRMTHEDGCVNSFTNNQEDGSVGILGGQGGGKYQVQVVGTDLCGGPGEYNITAHLNGDPQPLAGVDSTTSVILQ
jgi:hypothetical protein